jgi:hypothetical protein
MLRDHGLADKHTLHGEALRVPLLVRWPQMGSQHAGATGAWRLSAVAWSSARFSRLSLSSEGVESHTLK